MTPVPDPSRRRCLTEGCSREPRVDRYGWAYAHCDVHTAALLRQAFGQ